MLKKLWLLKDFWNCTKNAPEMHYYYSCYFTITITLLLLLLLLLYYYYYYYYYSYYLLLLQLVLVFLQSTFSLFGCCINASLNCTSSNNVCSHLHLSYGLCNTKRSLNAFLSALFFMCQGLFLLSKLSQVLSGHPTATMTLFAGACRRLATFSLQVLLHCPRLKI
jgi:hypothetical protein